MARLGVLNGQIAHINTDKAAGFTLVEIEIGWNGYEPTSGSFDASYKAAALSTASAGSTTGFTYRAVTWGGNEEGCVNLALAASTGYSPTCTQSPASLSVADALILTYTVPVAAAAIPANLAGPNGAFF